jgi:hypothetical protein
MCCSRIGLRVGLGGFEGKGFAGRFAAHGSKLVDPIDPERVIPVPTWGTGILTSGGLNPMSSPIFASLVGDDTV